MSKPLREFRERYGYSREQVAEMLTERLGRPIKPGGVQRFENYPSLPKSWSAALGLEVEQPTEPVNGETAFVREEWEPPQMPDGARLAEVSTSKSDYGLVRSRLAKMYGAIGAGASMVTQNDGYAKVADAYADDLAAAWVAAARENRHVERVVQFMESGGPVGELVVAHLILVGGFVYVSGRGPALEFLYGGKFGRYHTAAAARLTADAPPEPGLNGSARERAEGAVADAAS